jgi:nicotinate-nucleotide adenylyltransferase
LSEIIIFGGTFDPIHIGHLIIAEQARIQRKAESVLFVPTFAPPHKSESKLTNYLHRYIMVCHAIQDNSYFEASDIERNLSVPSYTLNTIKALRELYPAMVKLSLLIGADMLGDMKNWHKPQEIIQLCDIIVTKRPGFKIDIESLKKNDKFHYIDAPHIEISSSMIRQYASEGRSFLYMVPTQVEEYILLNNLYL